MFRPELGTVFSLEELQLKVEQELLRISNGFQDYISQLGDLESYSAATFAKLSGGSEANFASMPQLEGAALVARGSNSNGDWVRFADGTQICWYTHGGDSVVNQTASTGQYYEFYTRSFAASFSSRPVVSAQGYDTTSGIYWATCELPSTTAVTIELIGTLSNAARLAFMAVGRWF